MEKTASIRFLSLNELVQKRFAIINRVVNLFAVDNHENVGETS